ncbi:DUF6622 family protein [Bradyrhizobium australiense]|uniref:Transmembrane protein n=1 Tax=Bradyrhizobium australiense TaxID=2721161 RepID=A0A7Y4LVX9_9BRAD|nr:DUF6622 family protein [Bradyrhizobium australiense]NOJ40125.1 hypothetical protein [Bradyrhizobium australiense]
MQIAIRILGNTPIWVFALLAFLIWQGLQALRPRTQPIWRMLIVPLAFFLMGLSRLVLARDNELEPLLAWFVAAMLFLALALFAGPRLLAVDRKTGAVTRPGSVGPLVRNITVFLLQYGVAVATAMKLEPRAAVAIIGHAVSGACAGYFSGWAAALLRRSRNFRNDQNTGPIDRT